MHRSITYAAFVGLMALGAMAAGPALATDTIPSGLPGGLPGQAASTDNAANTPAWLNSDSHSDLFAGPNGFWSGTSSTTSANLGSGVSLDLFSSVANAPGSVAASPFATAGAWSSAANPSLGLSENLYSAPVTASNVGGRISMDVGNGVSVNFAGSATRYPAGYYPGLANPLPMTSNGSVYGSVGGGVTFDLGNGSSLSFSGGVSRSPYGCGAMMFGGCH